VKSVGWPVDSTWKTATFPAMGGFESSPWGATGSSPLRVASRGLRAVTRTASDPFGSVTSVLSVNLPLRLMRAATFVLSEDRPRANDGLRPGHHPVQDRAAVSPPPSPA